MENQNGGEGLRVSQLAADARDHLVPKSRLVGSGEGWMEQGSLTARWGGVQMSGRPTRGLQPTGSSWSVPVPPSPLSKTQPSLVTQDLTVDLWGDNLG